MLTEFLVRDGVNKNLAFFLIMALPILGSIAVAHLRRILALPEVQARLPRHLVLWQPIQSTLSPLRPAVVGKSAGGHRAHVVRALSGTERLRDVR